MRRILFITFCCLLTIGSTLRAQQAEQVTLGNVTFMLAGDYEIRDRGTLNGAATALILPKGAQDSSNRLILLVHPNPLEGINGLTSEEIHDMLYEYVDSQAGLLANKQKSGFNLEQKYKIYYDDNANGSYYPHCYCYLKWTDRDGHRGRSYSEATLVNRKIVSCTAIAINQGELNALTDIFSEVVAGAAQ